MATMLPPGNIDWEVPEYQNALKLVIKYEIQTLLERLSQTGEETVVLTANTTDLCVGHLASEKGKKFLNTNEVGEMKNKFLYYCTVEGVDDDSGITVSVLPQTQPSPPARGRGKRGQARGTATGRGKRGRAKAEPVIPNQPMTVGQVQGHGDVGQRLAMPEHMAVTDAQTVKQFQNIKAKTGEKRQQSFTAEEIQDMIVSAESKRRKLDSEKHTQSPMSQVYNRLDKGKGTSQNSNKLPQNKQTVLLSEAESSDFYDSQEHDQSSSQEVSALNIKTPRFTQENLEFQKFLQQYNEEVNKKYGVEDSEYDEEEYEDDMESYEMMGNKLEKGEIPHSSHYDNRAPVGSDHSLTSASQASAGAGPSQFQRQFQNFQKNNQAFQKPQTVKGQAVKEEADNIHTTSSITDKDSKSGQSKPQISLQSIINNATKKLPDQSQKPQSESNEAAPNLKEDGKYKQSADSSTSGLKQQADSSNQHIDKSPNQPDLPDSTQQTRGPRGASPRPVSSSDRTKTEDLSEADVSAKLEMLSAKMSWVVEYPKNFKPNEQQKGAQQQPVQNKQQPVPTKQQQSVPLKQQPAPMKQQQVPMNFPQEEEEEEEEEEEYPEGYEEDYEEEGELDEEAMKQFRANQQQYPTGQRQFPAGQGQFPSGQRQFPADQGQFVGEEHPGHGTMMQQEQQFEEYEEEDYDEEAMAHLGDEEEDYDDDDEYGELDSEDEQTLREMGHLPPHGTFGRIQLGNIKLPPPGGTQQQNFMNKGQISEDIGNEYGAFDTENFLMMGAMAKCLVCNKLVRKNDIVQHNIMHIQEDAEEEDEEEIEGVHDEEGEMGEMEEMQDEMGQMHDEMGEMPDQMGEMDGEMHGDMNEDAEEMNEEDGMQDLPEEMEEMHGNMLEGEGGEDDMGAGPHGELQDEVQEGIGDVGEHVEYDTQEGGETHEADQTVEKGPADQLPPNTCEICNKTFKNKYSLVKHIKIHDPKDLECDLCNKTFRLDSYLTKHRKKMHPNAPVIPVSQGKDVSDGFSSAMSNEMATEQHQLESTSGV